MMMQSATCYICEKCGRRYVDINDAEKCESLAAAKESGLVPGSVVTWQQRSEWGNEVDSLPYLVKRVFISSTHPVTGHMMRVHREYASMCLVGSCTTCSKRKNCDDGLYTTETVNLKEVV